MHNGYGEKSRLFLSLALVAVLAIGALGMFGCSSDDESNRRTSLTARSSASSRVPASCACRAKMSSPDTASMTTT
jgi:hypothetical protein